MTGWIIAGGIIAFLLILLMTSVRVSFEYSDQLRLKISWLFVTLVRVPAKTKKMKRRDKKAAKSAEKAADTTAEAEQASTESKPDSGTSTQAAATENPAGKSAKKKPEKSAKQAKSGNKLTLKDIFELVKLVWDSLNTPLKRLLKATRISGFRLNIVVGGDDAAKTAIKFGAVSAAAGNALAFLDGCFTLKKPDFNITCDFMSEETLTECEFTAKLTLIAALAFLFWLLGRFVKNYLTRKDAQAALNKLKK